jgi:hypothetical protein
VLVLDADLQDPPELLTQMLELMDQVADVVFAQRRTRLGDAAPLKRFACARRHCYIINKVFYIGNLCGGALRVPVLWIYRLCDLFITVCWSNASRLDEFGDRCHPDGKRATFRSGDHRAIPWQNSRVGEGKTHLYHSRCCAWSLAIVT